MTKDKPIIPPEGAYDVQIFTGVQRIIWPNGIQHNLLGRIRGGELDGQTIIVHTFFEATQTIYQREKR